MCVSELTNASHFISNSWSYVPVMAHQQRAVEVVNGKTPLDKRAHSDTWRERQTQAQTQTQTQTHTHTDTHTQARVTLCGNSPRRVENDNAVGLCKVVHLVRGKHARLACKQAANALVKQHTPNLHGSAAEPVQDVGGGAMRRHARH